ncbi:MAG: succinylglutamate desuccinylase/aspartoacylase family protein [Actinobacteria bacterium]|nr:succinylglutamate desuccinylase/aspartoacylase family protein [Actinomycetota bacterium]
MSGTVSPSFDLNAEGKEKGYLIIGDSTNESGWANFHVPIIKIKNGDGPTVLVLAGNHGDEYEGQFAAAELARELLPDQVHGRVIIIPCLSQTASKAGTRHWPSGVNFNRSFPGDENGAVSDKLAHFISTELFPISDAVVDMHSGGRGMYFIPCSHMIWVSNKSQRSRMISSMISWNTSHHLIFPEQPGTNPASLLPGDAERQGTDLYTTELGGAGVATYETTKIAKDGLSNALRHAGVIPLPPQTRQELGLSAPIFLDMRGSNSYVYAMDAGVYENLIPVGEHVKEGEPVGMIHNMDHPSVKAIEVLARQSGVVGVMRGFPRVTLGDLVAVIGKPYKSIEDLPE